MSLVSVTAVFNSSVAFAETPSLFNMRVGMSKTEARDAHPELTVFPSDPEGTDENYALGDIRFSIKAKFTDDGLQEVCGTFYESGFSTVVDALKEKYGPGDTTKSVLQNRMGAQFDQLGIIWSSPDAVLTIIRYFGGSLEKSRVCLLSGKLLDSVGDKAKKAKEELKKGL